MIQAAGAEIRLRFRRRKGERELALHVPPGARARRPRLRRVFGHDPRTAPVR
ncbi:MAG TPA: hypothetical protein VHN14_18530 [Kofleriaceae bacterium]|jgi:hypothetical protein|nr:hypothetical protein [Kofleriaceae bacterium]